MATEFNNTPWVPISNPADIKVLGKLIEELSEATKAAARCLIQGLDEKDPKTGEYNNAALMKELADVLGCTIVVCDRFGFDTDEVQARAHAKASQHRKWLEAL